MDKNTKRNFCITYLVKKYWRKYSKYIDMAKKIEFYKRKNKP